MMSVDVKIKIGNFILISGVFIFIAYKDNFQSTYKIARPLIIL